MVAVFAIRRFSWADPPRRSARRSAPRLQRFGVLGERVVLVFTLTTTDMPGRSKPSRATSPVRGCAPEPLHDLGEVAGARVRRQQREHRAGGGEKLSTVPSIACSGSASTAIEAVCPGRRRATWVSLKLAVT